MTGSIISKGNLFRWLPTAVLAGTRLRSLMNCWPYGESMKSVNSSAACGRAERGTTLMALGRSKMSFSACHFTGAPFDVLAFNVVVVDGAGDEQFAGRLHFGQQRVAAAYLRLGRGELLEIRHAFGFAHVFYDGCKPVNVTALDTQFFGKARVQQIFINDGHFFGLDELDVVADVDEVEAVGDPMAVLRKCGGRQVFEVQVVEFSEQLFAVQRFHLGAVGREHLAGMAAGARFGYPAQQHLHAGELLESAGHRDRVFGVERCAQAQLALLARAF